MKKLALITILVLALMVTTVVYADNLGKASGAGRLRQDRTFSFNAQERRDGTVTGNGVLTIPVEGEAGNVQVHFDVDCLNIDGNSAIMSGPVTKSTVWPEGIDVWYKVVDNGEGANATAPDQMTYLIGDVGDCSHDFTVEEIPDFGLMWLEDIIAGNIQVK